MASIGAVLSGLNSRPEDLPIDIFEIQLKRINNRMWFEPGDVICGNVILRNSEDFNCAGVDVCLEGIATVSYSSGSVVKTNTENILPYEWAIVNFLGGSPDRTGYIKVPKSHHKLPFCIPVAKLNPFLGSFKGNSGNIEYRIAAHVNSQYYAVKTTQRNIRMTNHFNIQSIPELLSNKPYITDGPIKKSIFSSSSSMKFRLTVPLMGVIAGESFSFFLELFNPHEKNISRRFVTLLKKTTFKGENTVKSSKLILDSRTTVHQTDLEWRNTLMVPKESYPSTDEFIIQHQYYIVVEVFTDDRKEPKLKQEIPLIVATADYTEEESDPSAPPPSSPRRFSQPPPPPHYSQLSTRSSSFETCKIFFWSNLTSLLNIFIIVT